MINLMIEIRQPYNIRNNQIIPNERQQDKKIS